MKFDINDIKDLIANLSPDFIRPLEGPIPDTIIDGIKEHAVTDHLWCIPFEGKEYFGITYMGKEEKPQSIRDAIETCITEYVPDFQAIIQHNTITFILPREELSKLILAVDLSGDNLTPNTENFKQHNPTLDR